MSQLLLPLANLHPAQPRERGPAQNQLRSEPLVLTPPPLAGARHSEERARAAQALAARLRAELSEPVEVELTDNAWTMVSYRRTEGVLRYRLHHMFARAEAPLVRALAGFSGRQRRRHGPAIDAFIRENRALIRKQEGRARGTVEPRGRVHDLAEVFATLNARHFGGNIQATVGWGRKPRGGRRRSIKMGVYFHEQKLIRIHPALDDERVPRLFVELVMFHEMLHQAIPPRQDGDGRRAVHSPEFRAAERAFPGYAQARAWEKANLHLLLR